MNALDLRSIARAMGGEISGGQVLCPGPGHSAKDRSLSIRLDANAPDGFIVHSFCDDDPIVCRDYVRERLGMAPFNPNCGRKTVATYEFRDPASCEARYRKERVEAADGTKSFFFNPKGRGGTEPLLYGGERLADVASGQPVFIVEGEKKVERLRELGAVAVSGDAGASSKWLPAHADLLRGLPIILWPDSDEPGDRYISRAAKCLEDSAASLKVVRPFGPPNGTKGRDVCDWQGNAEDLAELAAGAEPFFNGQAAEGAPQVITRCANEIALKAIAWLWKYWLARGKLHIIAGVPETGKTTIALSFAAIISSGGTWPDGTRATGWRCSDLDERGRSRRYFDPPLDAHGRRSIARSLHRTGAPAGQQATAVQPCNGFAGS